MTQGKRLRRVEELVREIISEKLIRELDIPDVGRLSLTRVEMTTDLKIAKVYFSIYGSDEEKERIFHSLKVQKKEIRWLLGKEIDLKFVPELYFYIDESIERAERINELIREIHKEEDKENDSDE